MNRTKSFSFSVIAACAALFCFCAPIFSAGPVTHALLADHFLRIFPQYNEAEQAAFRSGTLFSDIRYISHLTREETHFPDVTIEDVLNEPSPFVAGMKFHSLVDNMREDYVVQGDHYTLLADLNIEHKATYLKFIEDEIVYPSLSKGPWKECAKTIHADELEWNIDPDVLKRWHYLLDLSFSYRPETLIWFAHLKGKGLLGVSPEEVAVWNSTFGKTAKREDVQTYVGGLLHMFASQVQK